MPSTTSIESTSYTLKLNANSQKVLNRITNWTKISNASRNQMPIAASAGVRHQRLLDLRQVSQSLSESVASVWRSLLCAIQQAPEDGLRIGVIAIGVIQSKFAEALDEIWFVLSRKYCRQESDHDLELPLWVSNVNCALCAIAEIGLSAHLSTA